MANRASYAKAMGVGESASRIDKKAAEELAELWRFVEENLFEDKTAKTKTKLVA